VVASVVAIAVVCSFVTGCVKPWAQVTPLPGMQQAEARVEVRAEAGLGEACLLVSAARPEAGWAGQGSPLAGRMAAMFERNNPGVAVEVCEVYWMGHANASKTNGGKMVSYFYYDRGRKLVGSDNWAL
jgi:aspartate/tyrosine/aromatic aminotransferase